MNAVRFPPGILPMTIHPCALDGQDFVGVDYGDPETVVYGLYEVGPDGQLCHISDIDKAEMENRLQFIDGLRVHFDISILQSIFNAGLDGEASQLRCSDIAGTLQTVAAFFSQFGNLPIYELTATIGFYLSTIKKDGE